MANILICIPAMDTVATGFAQSLAMLQKGGHQVAIAIECGSLVYDSRNKLAEKAIQMHADWTMWFDSDMIFEPDTMLKLLETGEDFVSGLYFRRSPPYSLVAFDELNVDENKWTDAKVPTERTECGGVGFGCVLVKADVIFDVGLKYGTWFTPFKGFGEDLSFCWRARECGYKVMLEPKVKCGHVGHMVVTEDFHNVYAGGLANESEN